MSAAIYCATIINYSADGFIQAMEKYTNPKSKYYIGPITSEKQMLETIGAIERISFAIRLGTIDDEANLMSENSIKAIDGLKSQNPKKVQEAVNDVINLLGNNKKSGVLPQLQPLTPINI